MSEVKFTEESFKSPAFKLFAGFMGYFIAVVVVLIVGIMAAILYKDFTHLGRAGAVITVIAITMAYKDFCLNLKNLAFDDAVKLLGKDEIYRLWAESFVSKYRDRLEEHYPDFSVENAMGLIEEINFLSGGEYENKDQYLVKWLSELMNTISRKLRDWEFKLLLLGTFLWAFSDLINILLGW